MHRKYIFKQLFIIFLFCLSSSNLYSDNHNVLQILEALQQDIKTLERAVYSDSFEKKNTSNEAEVFSESG